MKRCWGVFLCVLLFCLPVCAQAGPCLSIGSYTAAGETVEIAVSLKGNTGFVGYQMDVVYDAAFLQPVELKGGPSGTPTYNLQGSSAGESCVKAAYASMAPVKGDGVLFTIRFQVKEALAPGRSTAVRLKAIRLFSEDGTDIQTAVEDGTIAAAPVPGRPSRTGGGTAPTEPPASAPGGTASGSRPTAQTGSANVTGTASPPPRPAASSAPAASPGTTPAPAAQPTVSEPPASAAEPGQTAAPGGSAASVLAPSPPASLPAVMLCCIFGGMAAAAGIALAVFYRRKKRRDPPDGT